MRLALITSTQRESKSSVRIGAAVLNLSCRLLTHRVSTWNIAAVFRPLNCKEGWDWLGNRAREGVYVGIERTSAGESSFLDVLDRVLDKGIVIDGWMRVAVMGIDLVTVEGRVVVASIGTYTRHFGPLRQTPAPSQLAPRKRNQSAAEKNQRPPRWLYELLEGFPDGA